MSWTLFLSAALLLSSFEAAGMRWLQRRHEASWHIWVAFILWIASVLLLVLVAIVLTEHS
jgi:hypothetical protein